MTDGRPGPEGAVERVLLVCTGNQCRSPMAEALLRSKLGPDSSIQVASAGTVGDGTPPPEYAVRVMAEVGLDLADRPSRSLEDAELAAADLIVVMARQHLIEVGAMAPGALDRSFTLLDLIDRARQDGGRMPGESVRQWAGRMSAGRQPSDILRLPSSLDVADPMGGRLSDFERTFDVLDGLVSELAGYLQGSGAVDSAGAQAGVGSGGGWRAPRRRWLRRR